jgi:predicted metal-dependent hydrolase
MSRPVQYRTRRSQRAKRLTLRVLSADTVEIVVPHWMSLRRVPEIVANYRDWIERSLARARALEGLAPRRDEMPTEVHLASLGQVWQVIADPANQPAVSLREQFPDRLRLCGAFDHAAAWQTVLRRWLLLKGEQYLPPWLQSISDEIGLPYRQVIIRYQRSRWGSCSSRGTISLNARLLLLPPTLVEYVIVHELCHLRHMNHSDRFWRLVETFRQDARTLDRQIDKEARRLPAWSAL